MLRFLVEYYKPEGKSIPKPGEPLLKRAVVEAILDKHNASTAQRKFNALFATSGIIHAIEYYQLFKEVQAERAAADSHYEPLNIACVFSPPAEGNKDVQQIQEDLPQEKLDNAEAPEEKKAALKAIIADYNANYSTNHSINEFDLYYQDIQKRIKDQQYPNEDLPHAQKIDITIVVDMLLTGFDSKFLNTLYVDKNLKHHGLIQAFSRTNRVLNDTKPYGKILDFRQQEKAVDAAIAMFSGEKSDTAREIWLVDPAPVVITKLESAVTQLDAFMHSQGLTCIPEDVNNLKGDEARCQFINLFKEVKRLKTQLDQYTDLTQEDAETIEKLIPPDQLQGVQGVYLETAHRLKAQQEKKDGKADPAADAIQQLEFEFVLFSSAVIDYDYIMKLIAGYTQAVPGKQSMTRDELIGLIQADAKFVDERDDIAAYIKTLSTDKGMSEAAIREGYEQFKTEKTAQDLAAIAARHGLEATAMQGFVDSVMQRMIFDGDQLSDLLAPLGLGWKARTRKELALMEDLIPLLHKLAKGREISGLGAYE